MRVEPKIVMGLLFLPQIDLVNPYKGIHCCCLSIQEKIDGLVSQACKDNADGCGSR